MSKTRVAAIFAAALVSVFGVAACGSGEEVAQQAEQLEQQAEQLEQLEQRVELLEQQLDRQQKVLNQQVRETVKEETEP